MGDAVIIDYQLFLSKKIFCQKREKNKISWFCCSHEEQCCSCAKPNITRLLVQQNHQEKKEFEAYLKIIFSDVLMNYEYFYAIIIMPDLFMFFILIKGTTLQEMKVPIKDYFSICDQIHGKLRFGQIYWRNP